MWSAYCVHLMAKMAEVNQLPDNWLPVWIAPSDTDLEVGVLDKRGNVVALVFPVHKRGLEPVLN